VVQQERAIQTRRVILEAAAQVFAEHGYVAATIADILKTAGVTKGALYFHFDSKELLAKGILELQTEQPLPPQEIKLQEVADIAMTVAHRLPIDAVLRAGARLSSDPTGRQHYGTAWTSWIEVLTDLLAKAQQCGEVLPHVEPREIAELIVSTFNGVQLHSQLENNLADVEYRVSVLLNHLMPSIAAPAVLLRLDVTPDRGARVFNEANHMQATEVA
jgi:AcrR family transcriptional regulator